MGRKGATFRTGGGLTYPTAVSILERPRLQSRRTGVLSLYPTPGSFGHYCGDRGIALVTLEMPAVSTARGWQQNGDALLAAIHWLPRAVP